MEWTGGHRTSSNKGTRTGVTEANGDKVTWSYDNVDVGGSKLSAVGLRVIVR